MINSSPNLGHLNTWSSLGDTIWRDLDSVALLEEIVHWGQALRVKIPHLLLVCFLFSVFVVPGRALRLLLQLACLHFLVIGMDS